MPPEGPDWRGNPPGEGDEGALAAYARALRSHVAVVLALFVIILGAGLAYAVKRSPTYQATSRLQVNPLPQTNTTLFGLPLIYDSGDPTTNMETAATVVDSLQGAQLTAAALGRGWSTQRVQGAVNVQPEGQSNILDVTATADSPGLAARVANTFTTSSLNARRALLRQAVAKAIAATETQLAAVKDPGSVAAADLEDKLGQLNPLSAGDDPTVSLLQSAVAPRSSSGLSKAVIALLALLAAVVLASAAALLLELLRRPRLLKEEQLLAIIPGAVLARIAPLPRRLRRINARSLRRPLPLAISEACRGVRIQLDLLNGMHRTLLITSPFHGDGKTTTAVNLAREIASSGATVIMVDADLRKPDLGPIFGIEPTADLPTALESGEPLSYLRAVPGIPSIRVLATWADETFETLDRVARSLGPFLHDAAEEADYIILDAPPLGEVTDVLRFVGLVDDVLLVSRLGNTTVGSVEVTRELLDRVGRRPTGHLVIGSTPRNAPSYGYYYGVGPDGDRKRQRPADAAERAEPRRAPTLGSET